LTTDEQEEIMSRDTESRPVVQRDYRALRAVLRVMFFVSLILAPVFAIFPMLSGLLLPAVLMVFVAGGLLMTISGRQGRATPETPAGQRVADVTASAPRWTGRAASRQTWQVLGVLAVLAVLVAGAVFDPRLLVVGAIGVFAYMALFGLPVWLAAAAQAAEDKAAERAADRGRPGLQP
jgi:hypothetical protein